MVLREQRLHRASLVALLFTCMLVAQAPRAHAQVTVDAPRAANAISRDFDPVVVTNVLVGTAASEIYVYRYLGGAWEPIPYQIDRVSNGTYQTGEVTNLDADDEIVFMASDLGDVAPGPLDESLDVSGQWIEVAVADPLNPGDVGYAYIVRSTSGLARSTEDYVSFDSGARRTTSDNYVVGWAAGHNGLEHISLFGSGNVIDRTKTRLRGSAFGISVTITEEGTDQFPVADVDLVKDGPVRVIVERGTVITICYPSMLRTILRVDVSAIPNVVVEEVRVSTDLASSVTGTYYNENTAGGVPIDGANDDVDETPFNKAWRQVALASGAMLQVTDLSSLNAFPRHYYKDDASNDPDDTGDGQSRGDSGFRVVNPTGTRFTLDSNLYFLAGAQTNRGSEFVELYENPVEVTTALQGDPPMGLYLPSVKGD